MSIRNLLPLVLLSSVLYAVPANGQEPASWARDILNSYSNTNREVLLDNRMRAQVVVGDYRGALATYDSLKGVRSKPGRSVPPVAAIAYEIFLENALRAEPLDTTFARVASSVDDRTSAVAMGWSLTPWLPRMQADYDAVLTRVKAKADITLSDKLDVVRRAAHVKVFSLISPDIERLLEADDQRRYIITRDIIVRSPQDGQVCVMVWRPRKAQGKLTALLNFTVYESLQNTIEARRTASNGYAGVEGLTRGKGCSG
ncbi:MAG TPA: hypothetical protein VM100_09940, partial [Longimicrobiales bacterium]|nr:hypothetical protein [Longimicrobiales bacterium]